MGGKAVLAAALVSATSACESEGNCAAACLRQVTFQFAKPEAGTNFEITLAPGTLSARCTVTGLGETTCEQQGSPGSAQYFFEGQQLKSLVWTDPPVAELSLAVTVDDEAVVSESFDYSAEMIDGLCGRCFKDPQFVVGE